MLNYNHLFYFWTIAKEGGVTAACKKLRLAQPTLSGQLAQFESFIGARLFERRSRKLILNDKGKLVFDFADSIFKKGDDLMMAVQNAAVKDTVQLHVGVTRSLPKKNIHNFLKTPLLHQRIFLNLIEDSYPRLLELLKSDLLDFVISSEAAPKDLKGFYAHLIEHVPVVFVASPDYKNLRRRFPKSLQDQNVYLPTEPKDVREKINDYFKTQETLPCYKGEIQDVELLRVIAVAGHGVVAVPRSSVSDLLKSKELYIIGDHVGIEQDFYLVTTERKITNPVVLDIVKQNLLENK